MNPGSNHCGKPGHCAKQCKSKYHLSGQRLQENWRRSTKGGEDTNTPTATSPAGTAKLSICEQYSGALQGIDIPTADTVTVLTKQVCKVPLNAYGPVGQGLSVVLAGRSSSTIYGIHVHVEIIDDDYLGQINAVVSVNPLLVFKRGLLLLNLYPL